MRTNSEQALPAKIVHLTSVHFPFDTRIWHRECKTLGEAGYEVVLVAPHQQHERIENVRIHAVTRAKGRWMRMTKSIQAVIRAALVEDADLYHIHDPELIPVAAYLKARGKRVVYDVHEHYPQTVLSKAWIAPWLRRFTSIGVGLAEKAGARLFDGVITATPKIAERFPRNKTVTIHNFPILRELNEGDGNTYGRRPALVTYVGVIARERGAVNMVNALEHLPNGLGIRLMLAGKFQPEGLREELEQLPGWSHVEYSGWLSRPQVANLFAQARIGLVILQPKVNYVDALPVKLFEYMAAGLPVIASDFPLWRRIVTTAGCGLLVDPLDPKAIADAIRWLIENSDEAETMGLRGQEAIRVTYNWETEAQNLLAFYEDLLKRT